MNKEHARLIFATFSKELKNSMKQAALRNEWDSETWAIQADMVGDALRSGRVTPDEMAAAYREQPILAHGCLDATSSHAQNRPARPPEGTQAAKALVGSWSP